MVRRTLRPLYLLLTVSMDRFLETLHTGFCIEFVYSYLIVNYGDVRYFIHINWYVSDRPRSDVAFYLLDCY